MISPLREKESDVVIVGAGLVGSAQALALTQAGLKVLLLDAAPPPLFQEQSMPDLRCSALVPGTIQFLEQLQIWSQIKKERVGRFTQMQVWSSHGKQTPLTLSAFDNGLSELGFIVENDRLQQALQEALIKSDCETLRPVKITHITQEASVATISFETTDAQTYQCQTPLIIAADGANSWVREFFQFPLKEWSYDQKALVTYVQHQKSHRQTAWQVFLPTGTLAFLPLYDPYFSSIVWSEKTVSAQELMQDAPEIFHQKLHHHFGDILGEILHSGPRAAFDLKMQHAQTYIQPRVALIGDAAHRVHPLAGQGLNLGFADAQFLTEIIVTAAHKKRDIGARDTLRKFERTRRTQNIKMLAAIEFCQKRLSTTSSLMQHLQIQGLWGVTHLPWVKKELVQAASFP